MQVTVTIHEAWLARPEDLRRVMALLAGLEGPPPGAGPRQTAPARPTPRTTRSRSTRKGEPRPGRAGPGGRRLGSPRRPGRTRTPRPTGRQLLGWARSRSRT